MLVSATWGTGSPVSDFHVIELTMRTAAASNIVGCQVSADSSGPITRGAGSRGCAPDCPARDMSQSTQVPDADGR
ncbi:hypothetical protein A8M60_10835 [Nocardia farcinica]|nr:hypothetical protein A8M60_10835 [Nocardia farcinica]